MFAEKVGHDGVEDGEKGRFWLRVGCERMGGFCGGIRGGLFLGKVGEALKNRKTKDSKTKVAAWWSFTQGSVIFWFLSF